MRRRHLTGILAAAALSVLVAFVVVRCAQGNPPAFYSPPPDEATIEETVYPDPQAP